MNKTLMFFCLFVLSASSTWAQVETSVVADSGVVEQVDDMPEGLFVSEEELMKDYTNFNSSFTQITSFRQR